MGIVLLQETKIDSLQLESWGIYDEDIEVSCKYQRQKENPEYLFI